MADRDRTAHVLTVLNLKGGVGKTHASWLLASVSQEREQRILLIDLDPQANLSKSFLDHVTLRESVAMLFDPSAEADALSLVQRTAFPHIDIIPSTAALASFDVSDQREWEKTDGHLALLDPINDLRRHYDLIVFDCPPRLSLVSFAAICASDHVIVPLEAADWGGARHPASHRGDHLRPGTVQSSPHPAGLPHFPLQAIENVSANLCGRLAQPFRQPRV